MHIFQTNPLSESCACVAVQEASSLRTSPSWPRCAPRLASSPSSCPSTMSRGSNSWAWSWVAPLSSCTRTRPASQPPKTTPCSAASTWPMESKSGQHTRKCSLCCPSFKTNDQFLKQRNYIATERGALRRIQWKVENLRALVKVSSVDLTGCSSLHHSARHVINPLCGGSPRRRCRGWETDQKLSDTLDYRGTAWPGIPTLDMNSLPLLF